MLRTGKLYKLVHLLISLALFAGLALTPTQPAYAATYTVNSLEDTNDGLCGGSDCTLREAIISANATIGGADTILFSLSGTITLNSSLPGILANSFLTIDGSGQTIRINGHDLYRVLSTQSLANLTLKNLIIEEGYTAVYGSGGGGVYNSGTLTVDSCTFRNNVAADYGGAIYNNGTLTITNSLLYQNSTQYFNGGAIYVYTGTVTTINESNFLYNDAGFDGGAIYNNGNLEIDDTGFSFNEASDGSGGAIYNRADLEIQDGTFSANFAYFDGGALYNHNRTRNFHIYDSYFNFNLAWRDGGGAFIASTFAGSRFERCTFIQNSASYDGGGLRSAGGDFFIFRTNIRLNEAGRDGGGIYNGDKYNTVELSLSDMSIESNTAGQDGGGIYNTDYLFLGWSTVNGNQADRNGGGLYNDSANTLHLINNTFVDNWADKGGGLYNTYMNVIENCTFSANRADTSGGAIFGDYHTILRNTILANSLVSGNCGKEAGDASVENDGNNIDSGTTCGFGTIDNSMSNTDPLLGPLQFNGGPTKTMALQTGSPAIEGVIYRDYDYCIDSDQRHYPRPFGARCDIGAFEKYYRLFMPQVMKN